MAPDKRPGRALMDVPLSAAALDRARLALSKVSPSAASAEKLMREAQALPDVPVLAGVKKRPRPYKEKPPGP